MPRSTRDAPYPAGTAKSGTLTPLVDARTAELIERAVQIEQEDAKAAGTISFVSRIFCQTALPYRDPGPIPEWVRRNGTVTLRLNPGLIIGPRGDETRGYPFGVMPRYLLAWMTTEVVSDGPAVQEDGQTLVLGGSMNAFLRQIGLDYGSGKRGNATRLRGQTTRLATSSIIVSETRSTGNGRWNHRGENFGFIGNVNLWWSDRHPDDDTLLPNTIRLSEAWRDSIKASAVPLDTRALTIIQRAKAGPLALDLYYWLAHRLFTVRRPTVVPWALLANQFGSQYAQVRQFKAQVIKQLRVVQLAYPQARVNVAGDGLLLSPSPSPVPRQTTIDV